MTLTTLQYIQALSTHKCECLLHKSYFINTINWNITEVWVPISSLSSMLIINCIYTYTTDVTLLAKELS